MQLQVAASFLFQSVLLFQRPLKHSHADTALIYSSFASLVIPFFGWRTLVFGRSETCPDAGWSVTTSRRIGF